MKVSSIGVAILSSTMTVGAFAATADLDFAKINANIAQAMEPVVAKSKQLSEYTYQFDASMTNVAADRFAIRLTAAGKAPWSAEGFSEKALIKFQRDDKSELIQLQAEKKVQTDLLAFVRAAAAHSDACKSVKLLSGSKRIVKSQDCKALPRLAKVQNFDELTAIIQDHIKAQIAALTEYVGTLDAAKNMAKAVDVKDAVSDETRQAGTLITALKEAKVNRVDEGVVIELKGFELCGLMEVKAIKADLQPKTLSVVGDLQTPVGANLYKLTKPELVEVLASLERGEDFGHKLVTLETKSFLRIFESKLAKLGTNPPSL